MPEKRETNQETSMWQTQLREELKTVSLTFPSPETVRLAVGETRVSTVPPLVLLPLSIY